MTVAAASWGLGLPESPLLASADDDQGPILGGADCLHRPGVTAVLVEHDQERAGVTTEPGAAASSDERSGLRAPLLERTSHRRDSRSRGCRGEPPLHWPVPGRPGGGAVVWRGCSSCQESASACARCQRLTEAWLQRASLLRVARARAAHREDAEDAVSEAFARAAGRDFNGDEPISGWLNVVTQNITRRQYRDRTRAAERYQAYAVQQSLTSVGPEEEVCDRQFAASVARLAEHLPDRQRRALELKAAGLDVAAIAAELGEPYKVVESLLSRARTTMRALVSASLTLAGGAGARRPPLLQPWSRHYDPGDCLGGPGTHRDGRGLAGGRSLDNRGNAGHDNRRRDAGSLGRRHSRSEAQPGARCSERDHGVGAAAYYRSAGCYAYRDGSRSAALTGAADRGQTPGRRDNGQCRAARSGRVTRRGCQALPPRRASPRPGRGGMPSEGRFCTPNCRGERAIGLDASTGHPRWPSHGRNSSHLVRRGSAIIALQDLS